MNTKCPNCNTLIPSVPNDKSKKKDLSFEERAIKDKIKLEPMQGIDGSKYTTDKYGFVHRR